MARGEIITHEGMVLKAPGDGTAEVEIFVAEACGSCHAKAVCSAGKSDSRIINVKCDTVLSPGDRVTLILQQSQGFHALAIGYIIPFIVLIAAFVVTTVNGAGELASALMSFAALGIYYFAIWLFRKRIGEKFEFKIKV